MPTQEIDQAVKFGAEGVGLLRTEFLVTGRAQLPTEAEQLDYFRRVGAAFAGKTVIIRTYDLGGDKFPVAFDTGDEANPFLGVRVKGAKTGDKISVTWTDNKGDKRTDEVAVAAGS